jgi:hypothetical protein
MKDLVCIDAEGEQILSRIVDLGAWDREHPSFANLFIRTSNN